MQITKKKFIKNWTMLLTPNPLFGKIETLFAHCSRLYLPGRRDFFMVSWSATNTKQKGTPGTGWHSPYAFHSQQIHSVLFFKFSRTLQYLISNLKKKKCPQFVESQIFKKTKLLKLYFTKNKQNEVQKFIRGWVNFEFFSIC